MAGENETIADVIAEKRRRADEIERDCAEKMKRGEMTSAQYARVIVAGIRREADRLDAAHKRERGNSAALRNALNLCVDEMGARCRDLAKARGNPAPCLNGCEPVRKAKAALAAPPRNCDRPECATLEMATKTWIQEVFGPLCNNSKATMADIRTFDVWIYAPATEKEGGAK